MVCADTHDVYVLVVQYDAAQGSQQCENMVYQGQPSSHGLHRRSSQEYEREKSLKENGGVYIEYLRYLSQQSSIAKTHTDYGPTDRD